MKKYSILLFFTLGILLLACEADTETPLLESADSIVSVDYNKATLNFINTDDNSERGGTPSQEAITLHKRMAWAAYTTSMVFHDNANAAVRPYFVNAIALGNDEFSLDDLLGPNPSDGGLFKTKFEIAFGIILCGYATNSIDCPITGQSQPPPPPLDGDGFQMIDIPTLTELFISFLIDDNCLELYFPNGLNLGLGNNVVTSVAHPLNGNSGNWGIKRTKSKITSSVFVDPIYAAQFNSNVAVIRPWGIVSPECDYSSYGLNFDNFLD